MTYPSPQAPEQPPLGAPPGESHALEVLLAVLLVIGVGLLFLFTGMAGGLRAAPNPGPPTARPGDQVSTGRFEVEVRRAWRATKDPTQDPAYAPEGRYLVVALDMTVTAPESTDYVGDIQRGLKVRFSDGHTIDGANPDSVPQRIGAVLARDRSRAQLHPGMERRVWAVYELPKRQSWPSRITVSVYEWEFTPGFLDKSSTWGTTLDKAVAARVRLPVTEQPT